MHGGIENFFGGDPFQLTRKLVHQLYISMILLILTMVSQNKYAPAQEPR